MHKSLPLPQSSSPSQYQVAGMQRPLLEQRKLLVGHERWAQAASSSSELSPQSLSPSHTQKGSTQMLVELHLKWPVGHVVLLAHNSSASSVVLASLQSLIPLHTCTNQSHIFIIQCYIELFHVYQLTSNEILMILISIEL